MEIKFSRTALTAASADAVVVCVSESGPRMTGADCDRLISELHESGEFKGKAGECVVLHAPLGLLAKRLVLAGLGKEPTRGAIRKAVGAAVRGMKAKTLQSVAVLADAADTVEASVEAAVAATYEPDSLKSEPAKPLGSLEILAPFADAAAETAFHKGRTIAESQNFARALAAEPANVLNPTELANRARLMANQAGLETEVLGEDRMRQLGMGSLLGVAQGSAEPPVLLILRYSPAGAKPGGPHLGLVGKGVTFDTGGVSIKPADNMDKMKYDMCGAAAVIGAMRAIAALKPQIAVTALVPAVENMLGPKAQRPGDIVKSLNGKTIEVLNTDAEGRLILNDAITYAQRLGCTHLVDAATLTGSVVVALGHVYTGAYTNNQELLDRVMAASRATDEKIWQMPLEEDYKEMLKSAHADLANIGTRWGGSITAAWFLKEFADPTPWVHLDIAGTAYHEEAKPWMAKGPTGVGVRTMVELAMGW